MNITAEGVGAGCAVIALLGTVAGIYLAVVDRRQAKEMDTLEKRVEKFEDADEKGARNVELDRRALEKRIGDLERLAVTRIEHTEFRAEILLTVDKLGERIGRSIDKMAENIGDDVRNVHRRVDALEVQG